MIALHHGGPSAHSAAVLIGLAEKGIGYEDRAVDLARFEQHREDFLSINPAGQVPVLEHDGRTLTETFFILLYLDDIQPDPPLGGADAGARYAVQKWGKYVETHIAPNLAVLAWSVSGKVPRGETEEGLERLPPERRSLWREAADGFGAEEIAAARAALLKAGGRLAADLADRPWLAGADYTLADIVAYPHVARFERLGIAIPEAVADWLGRIAARPRVREALGETGLIEVATMGPERGRWG